MVFMRRFFFVRRKIWEREVKDFHYLKEFQTLRVQDFRQPTFLHWKTVWKGEEKESKTQIFQEHPSWMTPKTIASRKRVQYIWTSMKFSTKFIFKKIHRTNWHKSNFFDKQTKRKTFLFKWKLENFSVYLFIEEKANK